MNNRQKIVLVCKDYWKILHVGHFFHLLFALLTVTIDIDCQLSLSTVKIVSNCQLLNTVIARKVQI